jgi:hypothetical protein
MTRESESPKPGIHMIRRVLPWIPRALAAFFLAIAVISGIGFFKQHSKLEHCNFNRSSCPDPEIRQVFSTFGDQTSVSKTAQGVYEPLIQKLRQSDSVLAPAAANSLAAAYDELEQAIRSSTLDTACIRDGLGQEMIDDGLQTSTAGMLSSAFNGAGETVGMLPPFGQLLKVMFGTFAEIPTTHTITTVTIPRLKRFPTEIQLDCRL